MQQIAKKILDDLENTRRTALLGNYFKVIESINIRPKVNEGKYKLTSLAESVEMNNIRIREYAKVSIDRLFCSLQFSLSSSLSGFVRHSLLLRNA